MMIKENIRSAAEWVRHTRPAVSALGIASWVEIHSFPVQALFMVILRACMDLIYILFESSVYGYEGFTVSISPLYYLASWMVLLIYLPFCVELINRRKPSDIIMTILHHLFLIPFTSYCGCHGADIIFFALGVVYWGILLYFQFHVPVLILKKTKVKYVNTMMIGLTVLSCLLIMYISGRYTGFRLTLEFIDVYGIRAEASGYAIPTLLSYALSMMTIVMSILMIYWLQKKRYIIIIPLVIVYIFLFSIGAHKSTFFFLFLIFGCWFFYRSWMRKWISGLLVVACLGTVLEKLVLGSGYLLALFINRMCFLPVQICEQYFQFFSQNPLNLYREGIMGKLGFDELYSIRIPRVMGEFRNHVAEGANGGLLADLFSNLPTFPGIILLPLILVICFRLLDMTAARIPERFRFSISFYYAAAFLSGYWSTILLTNGFLLTCMLLYFYPSEEDPNGEVLRT